jgi:hypothetical protein
MRVISTAIRLVLGGWHERAERDATHFEIARFINGKFVGQPLPCASLREAQEEALYLARGNLLDDKGTRAPGLPIFELDDGEEPDEDGLYIRRVVTKIEATAVF